MKTISSETENKFNNLRKYLSTLNSAAVAYSGGVDSSFLLHAASTIPGLKLAAYTIKNVMISDEEIDSAVDFTKKYNIEHHIIDLDILSFEKVTGNQPDRCYHCKTTVLKEIIRAASGNSIDTVLEGSHTGDLSDYRPGLKAIEELGVVSPLKDAGLDKNNIYEVSAYLGLSTSDKESYPCLATRIPYGTALTAELLKKAGLAEKILASFGFRRIRARIHGDILRIEVAEEMIHDITSPSIRIKLYDALRKAGFIYITVDLQGYRSGSMNLNLEGNK